MRDEALQKYEENVRLSKDDYVLGLAIGEGVSSEQWEAGDV